MVQIECANVEKHAVKMMAELNRMKLENDHCDFIIQAGNDVYYTHKNVLSAGSDYFRAILKHGSKESREGRVVFKNVDSHCVKNCIDFIYSGKFEIPNDKIYDLMYVAMMMQLEDVKRAVSDSLAESITIQNYFLIRKIADMYGLDVVCSNCRTFFQENIMEISELSQFGCVEKNDILCVTRCKKSKLCEEDKLMVFLKWAEKNHKNNHRLHDCFESLRFDEIPPTFLKNLLQMHPIISNDFGLYKLINGYLMKATVKTNNEKDGDELILLFDDDTDCIRSFNPITKKVEKFHEAKFKHLQQFGAISLDTYIYALCENKSVHRLNFRTKNSRWERMKDMICDHGLLPRSVSLSGFIFLIGGSDKPNYIVERFDPSVNQWLRLENKPKAIRLTGIVTLNDSIYCIGNREQSYAIVSSFSRFTPSSSEWVDLKPMRYPVYANGVAAVGQRIFVIGGWTGLEEFSNVKCYDVASAEWTLLSSMNMNIIYGPINTYHVGNWIFAVTFGETSRVMEKYDVLHNKWHKVELELAEDFNPYESAIVKL